MPVLSLPSLLWRGNPGSEWLHDLYLARKLEEGTKIWTSPSGSGPTLGHYAILFPIFIYLFIFSSSSLSKPCCYSASVPVVTLDLSNLFMCLLPQQDTGHWESWSELLSTKIYVSLCTRDTYARLGQYKDLLNWSPGIPYVYVPGFAKPQERLGVCSSILICNEDWQRWWVEELEI